MRDIKLNPKGQAFGRGVRFANRRPRGFKTKASHRRRRASLPDAKNLSREQGVSELGDVFPWINCLGAVTLAFFGRVSANSPGYRTLTRAPWRRQTFPGPSVSQAKSSLPRSDVRHRRATSWMVFG